MPQNLDNSCGGQVWVTDGRWGPFEGQMLHTSYGAAALLHVMTETVDGVTQGAAYRFPLNFATGIMRGRFRPQDGQLYVCGLRGWQTAGVKDGAFQRVRYTGKPVHMPAALNVHKNGIRLGFTCPLDRETAEDADSYGILQWNYKWSANYGSPHFSARNPAKQGYDTVEVKSARLLPDGKTVFLEIPDLRPVMQMKISYRLDAADGTEMKQDVYNTIHALGPALTPGGKDSVGATPASPGVPKSGGPRDLERAGEAGLAPTGTPVGATPASPGVRNPDGPKVPNGAGDDGVAPTTREPNDADKKDKPRKIVLIAGKKSHGPGEHEYEKAVRLLQHCLDTSPNLKGLNLRTEIVLNGWPEDEKVLEDADTVFLFCDGADQDPARHPLLHGDRLAKLGKLMDRGVGLVCMHYTVFVPTEKGGRQFQEWIGGYFDYDSATPPGGNTKDRKNWYSQLGHATTTSTPLAPDPPILRGVKPFTTRTEYYWKMRFKPDDARLVPLLTFDPKRADPPVRESVVAWAVERKDGGRGFGFTEGHFHSNWQIDGFRRMVLNALLWTAHADVPEGGVGSTPPRE
jgi:type 1 glutamine amidotransferase